MLFEVKGLVIRTVDIKETDRLITIFTEERGVLTALARGARSLKSRKMSSTMQFCYGSFIIKNEGDKNWIKEAELIESFFDIRNSIEGLALATYFAEILSDVTVAEAERELLRLSLNSLYAIGKGNHSLEKIKAVFEIRTAAILGFMPDVLSCRECEEKYGDFFFDIMGGNIECAKCRQENSEREIDSQNSYETKIICILSEGAKIAMGYAIYSPIERVFSFKIEANDMRLFSRAAEQYLLNQLGHSFKTLDFYNSVKR